MESGGDGTKAVTEDEDSEWTSSEAARLGDQRSRRAGLGKMRLFEKINGGSPEQVERDKPRGRGRGCAIAAAG